MGAGVFGLAIAAELARRGAHCTVVDPAAPEDNASGVSAGMLAPAFEAALDPLMRGRLPLLRAARDLWPGFSEAHAAAAPDRSGALWLSRDEAAFETTMRALTDAGAAWRRVSGPPLAAFAPVLAPGFIGAFTAEDWRIETGPALHSLRGRLARRGALCAEPAQAVSARAVTIGGRVLEADLVVVAAGMDSRRFAGAAPELAVLSPVKGERLRFAGAEPRSGPTLRSVHGYLVPSAAGAVAGATMEMGVDDRRLTQVAAATLTAAAAELAPGLAGAPYEAAAAVRAATPDGLPLVGRSSSGVWLAAGAWRNGWLLAPLAAGIIADLAAEADPGPWAEALRPDRFVSRPGGR